MEPGSCYKSRYLQASFNGVSFEAIEATSEHGRRGAEGEFPFGNQTGYVDMGRSIRRYTLTARLADNDHLTRAALLVAACEIPGPGILVHPTRGVVNAACTQLTVRDNVLEEQGVTYLDLSFVEGALWNNGFSLVGSLLGLVLRPLLQASSARFRANYRVARDPIYLREPIRKTSRTAAAQYTTAYSRTTDPNPRARAELLRVSEDPVLVDDTDLMDEMVRKTSSAIVSGSSSASQFESFLRLGNWAASQKPQTMSEVALVTHMRVTSGACMAQASLQQDYPSSDAASRAMDQTLALLAQEASAAYNECDNDLFLALRDFEANYTRQMYGVVYGRPARMVYDFGGVVSPLQAAYALWDDSSRSRELSASNQVGDYGMIGPSVVAVPATGV